MNRFLLLFLPFLLAASSREELKLGDLAFQEGRYNEARRAYRRAVIANPKDPIPRLVLGHALFALGEYEYAYIEIRRGLELHPDPRRIHPNLLEYYPRPQEFYDRLQRLREKVKQNPQNHAYSFVYAYICYYGGEKQEAKKVLQSLLQQPLQKADWRWVKFYLSQLEEEAILAKMPSFVKGVKNLKNKEYLKAYQNFLKVLRKQPAFGIPALFLSHTLFALGYYKIAARYMRRGVFFRPHNLILNALWGKYYASRGEWIRLLLDLESHTALHPKDRDALELLAFIYYSFKRFVSAQNILERFQREGYHSHALKVLKKLLRKKLVQPRKAQQKHRTRLISIGKEYLRQGDYQGAVTAFQALVPVDPRAHFLAAFAFLGQEKYEAAGEELVQGILAVYPHPFPHILDTFSDLDTVFLKKRRLEQFLLKQTNWHGQFLLAFLELQLGKPRRTLQILSHIRRSTLSSSQSRALSYLEKVAKQALPSPKKDFQLKSYPKSLPHTPPLFVLTIQGKKYPVFRDKEGKLVVYYDKKFYLFLGSQDLLKPYRPGISVDLPPRQKTLPWKTLELEKWLTPEEPGERPVPHKSLWIPSQNKE